MQLFDPFSADFRRNPFEFYARYREGDPVHWGMPSIPVQPGTWYIFRHEDVVQGLKDNRFGREAERSPELQAAMAANPDYAEIWSWLGLTMLFRDEPDHGRLRSLVNPFFSAGRLSSLEPLLNDTANHLIDQFKGRAEVDIASEFSTPLPMYLILQLLGITGVDSTTVGAHTLDLTRVMDFVVSDEVIARGAVAIRALVNTMSKAAGEKREAAADDILSRLITACDEGGLVSEQEMVAMGLLLLTGGQETTALLISGGLHSLLSHPEQLRLYRDNRNLDNALVDEVLRYNSPVQVVSRVALDDLEFGGKEIKAGQDVMFMIGSANRDPEIHQQPEVFDITRNAKKSIPFGSGIHFCIGAQLTRMEGRVAFRTLVDQLPAMRLRSPEFTVDDRLGFRGPVSLPVLLN